MTHRKRMMTLLLTAIILLSFSAVSFAANDHSLWSKQGTGKTAGNKPAKPNGKEKPFSEMIKDKVKIDGLFTFYKDTVDNSVLMVLKPEQFDVVYLCGMTVQDGDGAFSEGSRMHGTFPFFFKRVGKNIMMLEKNIRVRADSSSTMAGAVASGISDGLIASTEVASLPEDSTKAILINPDALFVRDALNLGFFLGQEGRTGLSMDPKNSYFGDIRSFTENSEVDVKLHFKTNRPMRGEALQNSYSFFHTFRYSLSAIPETDYVPRYADDRVGQFLTIYEDYSELDTETPYVRYIDRWQLKKKNPDARISEPVKPIVFWIENTVPLEYRDAIAEGIEFWQTSFEKIGFRNAIIAKQMPDDADWDPADVRYSTVRWLVAKSYPYVAIGTSRQNPYTGQTYDADIGFVSEAIRGLYNTVERRVRPLSSIEGTFDEYDPFDEIPSHDESPFDKHTCRVGDAAYEAALGMAYLWATTGDMADKDDLTKEYVHSFLSFVVAHEVGHTLGFRHNFIASTIYNLDQINDREFTSKNGAVGTVMEYPAPNVAGPGKDQGEFYPSTPGPYDDWVIEYSYSDFGAASPDDEMAELQEVASRVSDPHLVYATDEDAFGSSTKSINPLTNVWDLGDDPIAFVSRETDLSREIWFNLISKFETEGTRYQKILSVFETSFNPYYRAASIVPKYVGGIYHKRMHVGDYGDELPFRVVPASEQRRAVKFLSDRIFSSDAFDLPADLLNKLQYENLSDFTGAASRRPTMDYPLHSTVLGVQQAALSRLYSGYILGRLVNNVRRFEEGAEKYTIYDMFTEVRQAIWSELDGPTNIDSFRRQLQIAHLGRLTAMFLSTTNALPADARTLAGADLDALLSKAQRAATSTAVDGMTKAHLKEVIRQIEAAQNARYQFGDS